MTAEFLMRQIRKCMRMLYYRAIEGISDMGIIRGSSGAADTDYDRLFLDGKEQKFYEYKGKRYIYR